MSKNTLLFCFFDKEKYKDGYFMIDNNDVKNKINQIEQGKFQNLCNKLLYNMGYKNINQLGSQATSDKTTLGTPDTYIIEGKLYISVEYTTQKTKIYTKILEDINKCINEYKKCGLEKGKIFYFYTSSNLKMYQVKKLSDKCQKENVELEIFSIDRIANMLIYEYPLIAKEFLGIEIDTLQIISVEEFLKQYNSVPFGVKINNKLLFREAEREDIIKSINNNSVTLISGKPGVGKTHLVLNICMNNRERLENSEILCIKNRNRELFDDLKKYIKKDKKYLLIIDDINNINGIDQILYFIDFKNVKIIATVRDYAKGKVIDKIKKFENETNSYISMGLININNLQEEQLVEILKSERKITNRVWIQKILSVSQKNPRLMMMTADVFLKKDISEDYKIEEIYSLYFENIIKNISSTNSNILNVLAIIAIFNVIDITNQEHKDMIKLTNITLEEFKSNMKVLNDYEIIDMIDENTAKIAEQCLSNYSIYLALIKNRTIKLSDIIRIMFSKYRGRLIETLNILTTVFGNQSIEAIIKNEVKEIWNRIDECNIDKLSYLEAFAVMLETEVFSYCVNYIKGLKENKKILTFEDINDTKNKEYCSNSILKLISPFKYSNGLDNALQIVEEYIKKDVEIIPEVYKLFAYNWGFQEEIYYNNYTIQIKVVKKIIELSQNHTNKNVNLLLLHIIETYFKTNGDYTEQSDKRTVRFVQYNLAECKELRELRSIMLDEIERFLDIEEMKGYIYKIIYKLYYYEYKENENLKYIAIGDKEKVLRIINKLNKDEFSSNLIISKIYKAYDTFEIEAKKIKLCNKEYKMYKLLTENYRELEERNKSIVKYIKNVKDSDIVELINIIKYIENEKLVKDNYVLTGGISTFWRVLFTDGKVNKLNVLEECLKNNMVHNMTESIVISNCIKEFGYYETKNIIEKYEYDSKVYWKIVCFSQIPQELINEMSVNELLNFIATKVKITKGHYISFEFLDKYLEVDKRIYIKVLNTLYKTYKNDKFEFSLYTSLLFNKHSNNTPEKLSIVFKDNYEILMDSYILLHTYKEHEDYDGTYFKLLINVDVDCFINKYIEATTEEDSYLTHEDGNCLNHIWEESETIVNNVIDKILHLKNIKKKRKLLREIFANNEKTSSLQKEYLLKLISDNILQKEIIQLIFNIVSEKEEQYRIDCINEFLINNNDIEYFKSIDLESMFFSWSGSEVPVIENRIKYYTKINENIKKLGIKYINHNVYIEKIIYGLEQRKKDVLRREFIEDWL